MINLAIADFMMGKCIRDCVFQRHTLIDDSSIGVYLLIIAVMDIRTMGVYFNYAIDWQHGMSIEVSCVANWSNVPSQVSVAR